jgi:hypothetical protein
MKKLILLLACGFVLNTTAANGQNIVKQDSTKVITQNYPCDKKYKKRVKRNGKHRTKAGKAVWVILDILKEAIPFLRLITK